MPKITDLETLVQLESIYWYTTMRDDGWVVKATDCKSVGWPSLVRIQLIPLKKISIKNALDGCLKPKLWFSLCMFVNYKCNKYINQKKILN